MLIERYIEADNCRPADRSITHTIPFWMLNSLPVCVLLYLPWPSSITSLKVPPEDAPATRHDPSVAERPGSFADVPRNLLDAIAAWYFSVALVPGTRSKWTTKTIIVGRMPCRAHFSFSSGRVKQNYYDDWYLHVEDCMDSWIVDRIQNHAENLFWFRE